MQPLNRLQLLARLPPEKPMSASVRIVRIPNNVGVKAPLFDNFYRGLYKRSFVSEEREGRDVFAFKFPGEPQFGLNNEYMLFLAVKKEGKRERVVGAISGTYDPTTNHSLIEYLAMARGVPNATNVMFNLGRTVAASVAKAHGRIPLIYGEMDKFRRVKTPAKRSEAQRRMDVFGRLFGLSRVSLPGFGQFPDPDVRLRRKEFDAVVWHPNRRKTFLTRKEAAQLASTHARYYLGAESEKVRSAARREVRRMLGRRQKFPLIPIVNRRGARPLRRAG